MSDATRYDPEMKWFDLSAHGVALSSLRLSSGKIALVIVGSDGSPIAKDSPYTEGMNALRFKPDESGFWFSLKYSDADGGLSGIKSSEFKKVFPNLVIRPMLASEIARPRAIFTQNRQEQLAAIAAATKAANAEAAAEIQAANAESALTKQSVDSAMQLILDSSTLLGQNHRGQRVYVNAQGRFVLPEDKTAGVTPIYENDSADDPTFLRIIGADGKPSFQRIALCAEGFIKPTIDGVILDEQAEEEFIRIAMESPHQLMSSITPDMVSSAFHRAIAHAVSTELRNRAKANPALSSAILNDTAVMIDSLPRNVLAHMDMHPAIAMMAGRFISGGHKQVFLAGGQSSTATIALGSTNNLSASVKVSTYDSLWSNQLQSSIAQSLPNANVNVQLIEDLPTSQIQSHSADFILGSFTSDTTPSPAGHGLFNVPTIRKDLHHAMDSLNALRESGVAIICVAGDSIAQGGKISESQPFINWLYNSFNVVEAQEIGGHNYLQDHLPTRVFVINGRKLNNDPVSIPDSIPVSRSVFELCHHMAMAQIKIYDPEAYQLLDGSVSHIVASLERIKETAEDLSVNEFQARYISMSVGNVNSLIPINLQYPQQVAFSRYKADPLNRITIDGNKTVMRSIEDTLAEELQFPKQHIIKLFDPEQRDALAMMIWRHKSKGKPFLLGDMTGMGKGRVLAAFARYMVINKEKVVFSTKSVALLNSFWQEVRTIGAHTGPHALSPFIVNPDGVILNQDKSILYQGDAKTLDSFVSNDQFPAYANVLLMTYSQVNRYSTRLIESMRVKNENGEYYLPKSLAKVKPSPRIDWLLEHTKDMVMICDESHDASGKDSNQGMQIRMMLNSAKHAIYSSATYAANEKKLLTYAPLLPSDIDIDEMESILKKGGQSMLEIMSSMLVAEGAMMTRSHNLSSMERSIEVSQTQQRNEQLNDRFAVVMMALNKLVKEINLKRETFNDALNAQQAAANNSQRQIKAKTSQRLKSAKAIGIQSTGIGSILQNICRQFALAVNADFLAEQALSVVKSGEKPIVYMGQTGETLLRQLIQNKEEVDESLVLDNTLDMPLFKDALHRMINNTLTLTRTMEDGSTITLQAKDLFKDPVEAKKFDEGLTLLRNLVNEFGDLQFSPFDTIRMKLEKNGLITSELSGRQFMLHESNGKTRFVHRNNSFLKLKNGSSLNMSNAIDTVDAFNNGLCDVLLMSDKGATGISLHAGQDFDDHRTRQLIVGEPPLDAIKLFQLIGRSWRIHQMSKPKFVFSSSGIPAEFRIAASLNHNLSKLSAGTSANRDSYAKLESKFDLLNPLGDEVAHMYLESRPDLIDKLGFTEKDMGEYGNSGSVKKSSIDSLSRRLSGRLIMLSTKEQLAVYEDLDTMYQAKLCELEMKGLSPLKGAKYNFKSQELSRFVVSGDERVSYDSEFDKPVYCVTLRYDRPLIHFSSEEISSLVDSGNSLLRMDARLAADYDSHPLKGIADSIDTNFDEALLEKFKHFCMMCPLEIDGKNHGKVHFNSDAECKKAMDAVLASSSYSPFKATFEQCNNLRSAVRQLRPGSVVSQNGQEHVVISITPPRQTNELNATMWQIKMVKPGDDVRALSMETLLSSPNTTITNDVIDEMHPLMLEFDAIPKGGVVAEDRVVLMGNMFKAMELCMRLGKGKACTFSDVSGTYHQAMLMPEDFKTNELTLIPVRLKTKDEVISYLQPSKNPVAVYGDDYAKLRTAVFNLAYMPRKKQYGMQIPKSQIAQLDIDINHLGCYCHSAPRDRLKEFHLDVKEESIHDVVAYCMDKGVKMFTGNDGMQWKKKYEQELKSQQHTMSIK